MIWKILRGASRPGCGSRGNALVRLALAVLLWCVFAGEKWRGFADAGVLSTAEIKIISSFRGRPDAINGPGPGRSRQGQEPKSQPNGPPSGWTWIRPGRGRGPAPKGTAFLAKNGMAAARHAEARPSGYAGRLRRQIRIAWFKGARSA